MPRRPGVVLRSLGRGAGFTTFRALSADEVWWATASGGGALVHLRSDAAAAEVRLRAWGAGAPEVADRLPLVLGAHDDPSGFDPTALLRHAHPAVREAWRHHGPSLVTPATGAVTETAVLAILEQRVTGRESRRAWDSLVRQFGLPVPAVAGAPAGMVMPPSAEGWRRIPSWEWHRAGVDGSRSATALRVAARDSALQRLRSLAPSAARERLRTIEGVGEWTAAEVAQRALGDSDAVSWGDFHLGRDMVFALTGAEGGDDADLAELLEPVRGHRYRVQRLVEMSGVHHPRHGPRITIDDHRRR